MQLTKNFWLNEFVKSQAAIRKNIDNRPTGEVIASLRLLCENILQPLRDHYRKAVTINSGYRCPELNKLIGGNVSSQHMLGEAADIEIPSVCTYDLALYISKNYKFDQLILEHYIIGDVNSGWVHVSYTKYKLRNQILTKLHNGREYLDGLIISS